MSTTMAGRGPLQRLLITLIKRYPDQRTRDLTTVLWPRGYAPHSVRRSLRGLAARGAIVRAGDVWRIAD